MVCIMAGGGGTRLFPLSQTGEGKLPKQFLAIIDHETLLQKTISRTPESFAITVIPEERFSDTVLEQAEQTGRAVSVLSEPFGCNTAAAMLYACAYEQSIQGNPDTVLCFVPADHEMDCDIYRELLHTASDLARRLDRVITIGIAPAGPETNYGYIRAGDALQDEVLAVERFVEKPDAATAESYLRDGSYYWNAGIFVAKASVLLEQARQFCPGILAPLLRAVDADDPMTQEGAYRLIKESRLNISIDYALMEKIAGSMLLVAAPEALQWNDLGNWEALQRYMTVDEHNNRAFHGSAATFDESDCVAVCNYTSIPVFITKMHDVMVVVTDQGILIRPKT
jgi:mannose-1-phosphate guanylyltransferase / mannose-6-phosphate isomerase